MRRVVEVEDMADEGLGQPWRGDEVVVGPLEEGLPFGWQDPTSLEREPLAQERLHGQRVDRVVGDPEVVDTTIDRGSLDGVRERTDLMADRLDHDVRRTVGPNTGCPS